MSGGKSKRPQFKTSPFWSKHPHQKSNRPHQQLKTSPPIIIYIFILFIFLYFLVHYDQQPLVNWRRCRSYMVIEFLERSSRRRKMMFDIFIFILLFVLFIVVVWLSLSLTYFIVMFDASTWFWMYDDDALNHMFEKIFILNSLFLL